MLILAAVAVNRIQINTNNIDLLVHQQNTKTQLVNQMLTSARERSLLMLQMHLTEDAFDRDEKMLNFNEQGSRFARLRMQLLEMNLSKEELATLDKQGEITQQVVPVQRKIVNALLEDTIPEYTATLIINTAVPMQDKVFEQLKSLLDIQQREADESFNQAFSDSKGTIITISVLAVTMFIFYFIIAIYIIKKITHAERLLYREKEHAQVTLHSIGDAVITTNTNGIIEYTNNEAERLIGKNTASCIGKNINLICPIRQEDNHDNIFHPIDDVIQHKTVIVSNGNTVITQGHDHTFAVEYTASPIFNSENKLDGTIIVLRNVTEMRVLNHQLNYQATHDALTGLINRVEFERITENLISDCKNTRIQHGLCFIDLDQFKVINDTCGHQAGDELLKQIAAYLKMEIGESNVVSRLGGDEFGIIFKNCSIDEASEQISSVREAISLQRFVWENKSFSMSVSAGLVLLSQHTGSLYDIFSIADSACYAAKELGRNRVHVYNEADDTFVSTMEGQMQWVHRIDEALEQNRFELYYQTIVSLNENPEPATNCELLVRMISETGDIIPPMSFIPSAERYNLMSKIDIWVVNKALTIISENLDAIITGKYTFSINLSAQSLSNESFLSYIQQQLKAKKLPANIFCFEITETTAISNLSTAKLFIKSLKDIGCKFSLDDFGSGLSSFEYLKNLSVDYLKIDGAFVRNLINDPVDRAMVQSINQVGHVMGISTIAEFAENKQIIEILKEIGIDYAQGYGISKPEPLSQFITFINQQ